jgi:hypothetical protein
MDVRVTGRALAIALAVMAALAMMAGYAWWRTSHDGSVIDLVDRFPEAEKRTHMRSLHDGFGVLSVRIDGERRRSIFAHPPSRIIWKVDVPSRAVLETAFAIDPAVWSLDGDGATFRVGVSHGSEYHEYVRQWVDPYHRPEDRRWFPVSIDLSLWAGREVSVIFNTEPNFNAVHDAALWGAPVIRVR